MSLLSLLAGLISSASPDSIHPERVEVRLQSPRHRMKAVTSVGSSQYGRVTIEHCLVWDAFTSPKTNVTRPMVAERLFATELPEPLAPFLVTNSLLSPASTSVPCGLVDVPTPPDRDRYDGRTWRVLAASAEYARAVLTDELWARLEDVDRRRTFCVWVDGRHVVGLAGRGQEAPLASLTLSLQDQLASGRLQRWVQEPDLMPARSELAGTFRLTGWPAGTPEPELLVELGIGLGMVDLMVQGTLDVGPFVALRVPVVGQTVVDEQLLPLDWEPDHPGSGIVAVPLEHEVHDRVRYQRRPMVRLGNVSTEWLDFDADFSVRSQDLRIGHEVTTPLLMQYLHDHRVRHLTVQGRWMLATVARLRPDDIEAVARTLHGARPQLPRRDLERG